jgi:hypothetical protein
MRKGSFVSKLTFVLVSLLMISFSILVFSFIYQGTLPKIVEEINNSCIGAILTAVITVFLLGQQTNSEEIKERNSKIFEKRLEVYEEFNLTLRNILKDKEFSTDSDGEKEDEIQILIFQLANIRMHTSPGGLSKIYEQVANLVENLSTTTLDDSQDQQKNTDPSYYNKVSESLFLIVDIFHKELYSPPPSSIGDNSIDFTSVVEKIVTKSVEVSDRKKFSKFSYDSWTEYALYLKTEKNQPEQVIEATKSLIDHYSKLFGSDLETKLTPSMISFRRKSAKGRRKVIGYSVPWRGYWSIMKNGLADFPKEMKSEGTDQIFFNISKEAINSPAVSNFLKRSFDELV